MFRMILIAVILFSPALCKADDIEKLMYATCRVSSDMTGSGVVIMSTIKDVYVLTARHVANSEKVTTIQFCNERYSHKIPAKIIKQSEKYDLSVLVAATTDFKDYPIPPPIKPGRKPLAVGDKVYTAGSPNGNWTSAIIGVVLNPAEYTYGEFMRMSPCILPGRSGSGVCAHGRLVGIVLRYDDINSEYTLCATERQILEFLGD